MRADSLTNEEMDPRIAFDVRIASIRRKPGTTQITNRSSSLLFSTGVSYRRG